MKNTSSYELLANKMTQITGVQFDEKNMSMVKSRIDKRIRDLRLKSIDEYITRVNNKKFNELDELISIITTHHTYFHREKKQFDFIVENLEDIVKEVQAQGRNKIKIWSAACSYGEEVYTLSMILNYHLDRLGANIGFEIIGSDICQKAVRHAQKGVYLWSSLKRVPAMYLSNSWIRGGGDIKNYVKASKRLKEPCQFKEVNLINYNEPIFSEQFDIILCRNVFIYFDNDQISKIVKKFNKCLYKNGKLFVGISETLSSVDDIFTHLGQSIYVKGVAEAKSTPIIKEVQKESQRVKSVLCVDDSPTVQKIVKKLLTKETGYEVVHCANNGYEAQVYLENNSVDIVILDLHMPVMDGLTYLEKNYNSKHPHVLIMSSINRENMEIAQKAISLGARDYVEKPKLNELAKCKEEILAKLDGFDYENNFERFEISKKEDTQIDFDCFVSARSADADRIIKLLTNLDEKNKLYIIPNSNNDYDNLSKEFENLSNLEIIEPNDHLGIILNKNKSIKGMIALNDTYTDVLNLANDDNLELFFVEDTGNINITHLNSDKFELVPYESIAYELKRAA